MRDLHILLTGFEPFGHPRPDRNPSWEAIVPLAGTTLALPPTAATAATTARIATARLPVEYAPARRLVRFLHTAVRPQPDVIVHVGLAAKSKHVCIETMARPERYHRMDNRGSAPDNACWECSDDEADGEVGDVLSARFDPTALLAHLHGRGHERVSLSDDAGLYLCEYVYYASLHEARRQLRASGPLVVFVHVPWPSETMDDEAYTLAEVTDVLREVCRWLAMERVAVQV